MFCDVKGNDTMSERTQLTNRFWQLLRFPLTRIVLAFVWLIALISIAQLATQLLPARDSAPVAILSLMITVAIAYAAYVAFVRGIEKRPVSELAAPGAVAELLRGVLLGAALFTLTIGLLWVFGYYSITGVNPWPAVIPILIGSVFSGVFEEMLFRGILFRVAEEALGTWWALLISALLFGLLHLLNPNASGFAAVAIALEAGVLLAAAYVLTRRLWLAIGIHFAWNFTQGGIFGVAVSGSQASGLLQAQLTGPELLSGGPFGAEASVVALVVCSVAGGYLLWQARARNHFVQPFWRR